MIIVNSFIVNSSILLFELVTFEELKISLSSHYVFASLLMLLCRDISAFSAFVYVFLRTTGFLRFSGSLGK